MPLRLDKGRIPPMWAERQHWRTQHAVASASQRDCLHIALINNMPDSALEDTELQFFDLLDSASSKLPIHVELYSIASVPRGERVRKHLNDFYLGTPRLLNKRFDGVIVTGTEPRQSDLRSEPYWSELSEVFAWAEENTSSAVLSCLAAHAGVLCGDGIGRRPLPDKQFGVFTYQTVRNHDLAAGLTSSVRFPHSRWNEVPEDALTSCGYSVITQSPETGVDLFVKKKRNSLFVHFQGHPEYGVLTLLKEFRRDVRRFLTSERDTFPSIPRDYFGSASLAELSGFCEKARSERDERLLPEFPESALAAGLENTWRASATCIYGNWLSYMLSRKAKPVKLSAVAQAGIR